MTGKNSMFTFNNKKLRVAVCAFALIIFLCSCANEKQENEKPAALPTPTTYPEVEADETKPLLFEDETVYENWIYCFLDVNDNNVAERFSFTNVRKNPDDASVITARLAVEFDFARNDSDDNIYIERTGGALVKPDNIYVSVTDDGALIILEDSNAFTGQEYYPFIYSRSTGLLAELFIDDAYTFPENGISKSSYLDEASFSAVKSDEDAVTVSYKDSFSTVIKPIHTEQSVLAEGYSVTFDKSNIVMSFDADSKTMLLGLPCSFNANESTQNTIDKISSNMLITLRFAVNKLQIIDISFNDK